MSEIIKLYENAGIEKRLLCGDRDRDVLCGHVRPDGKSRMAFGCFGCEYKNDAYPPFTAEKQIELIKLLGSVRDYTVEIDKFKGVYYVGCRSAGSNDKLWGSSNVFEDALAELINETWFCLTEEEKQQIKEILE